jgi:RNA polymerase sigma-70 factor (ECF subfamily)
VYVVTPRRLWVADERGFDEFYLVAFPRLHRQLTVMTVDAEQARDALQEAFARAWQRWGKVSRMDNPDAWVRTVAWRLCVSQHRRRMVAVAGNRRLVGREAHFDEQRAQVLDVREALRRLSPDHRRVLVLHEMCGLSVAEIAEETGLAVGTVKSRLFRARQAMATALGGSYGDGLDTRPMGAGS